MDDTKDEKTEAAPAVEAITIPNLLALPAPAPLLPEPEPDEPSEPAPEPIKILGPEMGYTDLLDYEILEKLKAESRKPQSPLRPSSAGYCARRLGYELMEYQGRAKYDKEIMNAQTFRLLNFGHSVEYSALQNLRMLPGFSIRYKQQVVTIFKLEDLEDGTAGPMIEGSLDAVLWSEKYKGLLDIKSQKDGWSSAHKSRWDESIDKFNNMSSLVRIGDTAWYADSVEALIAELHGDFLCDNLYQLNLYACSSFLRERGIDHAVVYKYGKNDSRHYEIRFKPSMELYEKTKAKFENIFKLVHAGEPEKIERESFLGSARCAFCPFNKTCWTEDATKAWFKTLPKKHWPTNASELGPELSRLFVDYMMAEKADVKKNILETEIMRIMVDKKIQKIKLDSGEVYELKYYKTPRVHYELKRSKL